MPPASAALSLAALSLVQTVALVALLAAAWGTILRAGWPGRVGAALTGALFGAAAVIAAHQAGPAGGGGATAPDWGGLLLLLAGAQLGPAGLAPALALPLLALAAGGGAAEAASSGAGLLAAGGLGLLWRRAEGTGPHGPAALVRLAGLSTGLAALALALPPVPGPAGGLGLALLPLLGAGALAAGALLERERRGLGRDGALPDGAGRDPLTGLLTPDGLLRAAAALRPALGGGWSALRVDLDGFGRLNARHGRPVGDAALRALGARVRAAVRPGDLLGRLEGGEVAVLLPALGPSAAEALGRRLCEAVRDEGFALPGAPVLALTASVGGAWAPGTDAREADLASLLARAGAAVAEAKLAGRDRSRFAAPDDPAAWEGADPGGGGRPGALGTPEAPDRSAA